MNQISGIVEQVGTKFNGSVKVQGKFYNFKKGVSYGDLRPGDNVTLELSPWEFKGKTGESIASFSVKGRGNLPTPSAIAPVLPGVKEVVEAQKHFNGGGRDFDKEARGKTRCSLFAAAVQSPALAALSSDTDALIKSAIEVAEAGVKYTFDD